MNPNLIGYFPKRTMQKPDWLAGSGVEEVCSVSTCVSPGPDDWIDEWKHNELFVFDTPELAWGVVPEAERGDYELHGYRMFPVLYDQGQQKPFELPPLTVEPLPSTFERLGVDVVSRLYDNMFECSPLSCNYMAKEVAVNRFCLFDELDAALRFAECGAEGCEPGPYYVVEVWREGHGAD